MEKLLKVLRSKKTNRQTAFKIIIRGDFFVQIGQRISQKEFSYFLLWTCFPFFSFFYQRLSSAFDFSTCKQLFHEQRASTCEFCKVRNLNKILKKNIKNEPRQERLPQKFPPGDPLRFEIMTPS